MSGRRDSNPLPTAWEAVALPGELLPLIQLLRRCVLTIPFRDVSILTGSPCQDYFRFYV